MSRYLDKNGLVTVFNIINERDNKLEELINELTEKVDKLEEVVKQYHPEGWGDGEDEDKI